MGANVRATNSEMLNKKLFQLLFAPSELEISIQ
jgi:hypothetical protein